MSIPRRQALVIGGSGAIGGAICHALARDGFDIALTYRTNSVAATSVAAAVGDIGVAVNTHALDVSDIRKVDELMAIYTRLDAVVYAAGPSIPMSFVKDISSFTFASQLGSDAVGFFNLVQKSLPALCAAKGSLLGIVTIAISKTVSRDLLSSAPKAVVEQIVRSVSVEYGKFGVRANCIAPGLVNDGLIHDLLDSGVYSQEILEHARRLTPLRRHGTPQDIAEAAAFLLSHRASWITGQTLNVDGGYTR